MLNRSKWCSEMRKSDGPPQAGNNLRDLHTRWVSLQSTPTYPHTHSPRPPLCKIHSGYVNGNVITQPWRIYGPVRTHTNVFMTVSRAFCKLILTGRGPSFSPRSLANYLRPRWWLLSGWRAADGPSPSNPGRAGAAVPRPRLLSEAFLSTISLYRPTFNSHLTFRTRVPPALVLHETNGLTQTGPYIQRCLDFDNIFSFPFFVSQFLDISFVSVVAGWVGCHF